MLLLSIIVFGVLKGERFFTAGTLTLILQQIAVVGILGAGQTLVILTAGIDLSIGVIMVLSAVIMGHCAVTYGLPAPIAIAAGFADRRCLRLYQRLSRRSGQASSVHRDARHVEHLRCDELHLFGKRDDPARRHRGECTAVAPVRLQASRSVLRVLTLGVIVLMVRSPLLLWYALNHTAWGRHLYAVGDDPEAARALRHSNVTAS